MCSAVESTFIGMVIPIKHEKSYIKFLYLKFEKCSIKNILMKYKIIRIYINFKNQTPLLLVIPIFKM